VRLVSQRSLVAKLLEQIGGIVNAGLRRIRLRQVDDVRTGATHGLDCPAERVDLRMRRQTVRKHRPKVSVLRLPAEGGVFQHLCLEVARIGNLNVADRAIAVSSRFETRHDKRGIGRKPEPIDACDHFVAE